MTGEILEKVLLAFNHRLLSANRSKLLLLDNAGCHPDNLKGKFSKIKIVFLPANTTSKLHPLDLGIIQNFKSHYQKFLLPYVLSKSQTASEVAASVNLLRAIQWVSQVWDMVQPITISRCFHQAGVLTASMDVCTRAEDEESDPFEDIEESEIQQLIERTMNTVECCASNKYVSGDDCLAVCVDLDDDKWEETDLASKDNEVDGEDKDESEQEDRPAAAP